MKKLYKTILLFLVFTFLTTYSPREFDAFPKKKNIFFRIQNIEIVNNDLIDADTIHEKLLTIYQKNIVFIKRNEIEKPLTSINFLEKIEVKKKYPNTIIIKVYETKPTAILYEKNNKYIIDSSSNLIPFDANILSEDLPSVFGQDANTEFVNFFDQLKNSNFPIHKIKNFYYFQIGRWDLQLLNNKIIKFPYNNIDEAIIKSVELLDREDFKNYNIIDLRVDGKIIVE